MKIHNKLMLFLSAALAASGLIACGSTPAEPGREAYTVYSFNTETVLFPELKEKSPKMDLSFSIIDPADTAVRKILYGTMDAKDYVSDTVADFEKQYVGLKSNPDLAKSASSNWTYGETSDIFYHSPGVLVISRSRESYTGGAHGSHEKIFYVIDLATMKQLSVKDVLNQDRIQDIKNLSAAALREKFQIPPGEDLEQGGFFSNDIEAPEIFYLSPAGLGFFWNQYDIAPYAMGPIDIEFSYAVIKDYLSPYGQGLFRDN